MMDKAKPQPLPQETTEPELDPTALEREASDDGDESQEWRMGAALLPASLIEEPGIGEPAAAELASVPAERVRFAAPVRVQVEREGGEYEGAVINLSVSGMACVLPVELSLGTRMVASFRPSLAESPVDVPCEVVWRRANDENRSVYGLSFGGVKAAELGRVDATVRERAEGRAGEWPLPVLPVGSAPAKHRGPSPLLTGLLGLIVGAGLSFLAAKTPNILVGFRPAQARMLPASAPAQSDAAFSPTGAAHPEAALVAPVDAAPGTMAAGQAGPNLASTGGGSPATPAASASSVTAASGSLATSNLGTGAGSSAGQGASPSAGSAAAPSQASAGATDAGSASSPTPTPTSPLAPATTSAAAASPAPAAAPAAADKPRITETAKGGNLTLALDGPAAAFRTFWLESPRRLVVDVEGRRSAYLGRDFTLGGRFASRVRVGVHPDKVRFVIETAEEVGPDVAATADGNSLVLHLKRR